MAALTNACPSWTGGTAEPGQRAIYASYCRRPDGAVRVPSPDEAQRFCATGRYAECPGYRQTAGEMFSAAHVAA
jgi:hypothetical protein